MNDILTYRGIEWECYYEYDAPQEADDTDPAIPGIATIYMLYIMENNARVKIDLIDFIDAHTIHALEKEIEDSHAD